MKTPLALRALSLCVPTLIAAGCYTYRPASGPLPAALATSQTVRVTRADSSVVVIQAAHVIGDSLVGRDPDAGQARAVVLADVRKLEVLRLNWVETVSVPVGAAFFYAVAVVIKGGAPGKIW